MYMPTISHQLSRPTAENLWYIQSRKGFTDTSTCPIYVYIRIISKAMRIVSIKHWATHVDLSVLKPLIEVVVDSFIGYFADECEVGYSDFFLLGTLENRLPDLGLSSSSTHPPLAGGFLPPPCTLCDSLLGVRL